MRKQLRPIISSSIEHKENFEYLEFYYPESYDFLYSSHFTRKREYSKLATYVANIVYDYSLNETFMVLFNGVRTFIPLNLRIIRPGFTNKQLFPLTNITLIKRRIKDLFFYENHFIFKSPQYLRYRNLKVKAKCLKKSYMVVDSSLFPKYFNKINFYLLSKNINKIPFLNSIFFRLKKYTKKYLKIRYLGFKLRLKTKFKRNRKRNRRDHRIVPNIRQTKNYFIRRKRINRVSQKFPRYWVYKELKRLSFIDKILIKGNMNKRRYYKPLIFTTFLNRRKTHFHKRNITLLRTKKMKLKRKFTERYFPIKYFIFIIRRLFYKKKRLAFKKRLLSKKKKHVFKKKKHVFKNRIRIIKTKKRYNKKRYNKKRYGKNIYA